MAAGPWLGIIAGAMALITLAIWSSCGAGTGRDAASAILQAQHDISPVQEVHVDVEPAALRGAEADLLMATTVFNQSAYETASEFMLSASRAAQDLLAGRHSADKRQPPKRCPPSSSFMTYSENSPLQPLMKLRPRQRVDYLRPF
jgi:hypothetical protein